MNRDAVASEKNNLWLLGGVTQKKCINLYNHGEREQKSRNATASDWA